ncbi:DEAD/DEAH box helicase family protein [Aliarcobacter cryaerophilus]|uniref:type I restriction endonuclease subunit R n=1 Tax=Aliarcobacter cryaerophilus TaxID=28198 RepID=UPI0021B56309|nr:DEAD/DEAH box helicase family protein [Aliarcobacter cryaerophilus]MCT7534196.1 DEAD/DEAH box helicase family protein [Aliarcobacter cryaerophilus]
MIVSKTNEEALESCIESSLLEQGFVRGENKDFNKDYAIDEKRFWDFLQSSQADELEKLKRDPQYKLKIIQRLDKMIKKYGILKILKKGLDVDDAHFKFFFIAPLASSGEELQKRFASNQFSITRQVTFSNANPLLELDMVIFINGLPIITMELKNHWTGQNARYHGIKQYKEDRDPKEPLLNFARCIVHFAIDTDEAFMTTKLEKDKTFFLPFNKGNNFGAGNEVNPNGHKTSYIWEEIFSKNSLANIIQHFVRLDGETLYFPRYHQLDVVRKLINDVSQNGVGKTYLIQHSAGSGKSNSITWSAYQLIEAYPISKNVQGSKGLDYPLFDSVIIVTDRKLLDKQLRDNVKSFSEQKNIVAPAYSSSELKSNLENGKKIILTTIQKFPFIVDGIADLSEKRFAVIIDEAHSSQSGLAHGKMNEAMGKKEYDEELDAQDLVLEVMKNRKMKGNASYLAFTATPKNTTLEKFGTKQTDGTFKPFHLYSMKQAIEEGFILDVLSNYTTYRSYYEIEKSIEDNPLFDTKKAQKKLRSFVEKNPSTIATKVEIILDHFIEKVVKAKKLKGKAKGMVVTANIETAIVYFQAINKKLEELGKPFKAIIAFSGKKEIDGIEYTEDSMNNFASKDISEKFDSDEYKLLVVANKFLTGFDQPKLCAMYVDKKLQGVLAVQALSRLNRAAPKYGKKTEDLFVLDFFNKTEDIKASFDPFYTSTTLSEATDINVLHELKDALDDLGVYESSEVDEFFEKYFKGVDASKLSPIIDTSAQRFNIELELEDEDKADYKIKAKQFVKIYGQMSSIMPYEIVAWEKLFWFLKFLIPKMIIKDKDQDKLDELLNSVDLSTYGLERVKLGVSI